MSYLEIVRLSGSIATAIMALLCLHFFFFAIVGVFKRKTYPHTEEKLRYGVIIPARNEEAVVGQLIESARRNNYPQDKLDIFVIAHNCTDRTAEVARQYDCIVYEYSNPEECTMGYAFRYLFDRINEDYGTQNYDGFFLFNADNILDVNFFDKMNDAFVAKGKHSVITSFRNSKNFGENIMSACYGLYFTYGCRFESRGRTALGCSTRVQGTGYVIPSEIVRDGWKYVTLTEDWEFTADRVLLGEKIYFCDEAVFYDEQPTGARVMWRQRLRWAKGHLLVCLSRFKDLVKSLFGSKKKNKGSTVKGSVYDLTINIMPACVIATVVMLLQAIAYLIAPFVSDVSFVDMLLFYLRTSWPYMVGGYGIMVLASIVIYIIERKRIQNVSIFVKIGSTLLWPVFLFISIPAEIVALFWRNMKWKPIPHENTTDFDALNQPAEEAQEESKTA